ncbi:hypothetical protein QE152_g4924 [Popillia japonica]|uniref:Uncharacterized protein n=1 Tax=Popillia japonica TaxID=7064 RepID=A0AAW1MSD4_POPJA
MTVIHYSVRGRALVGRGKGRARPVWPDPTDGQRAVVRTARLKPDGRVPQGERTRPTVSERSLGRLDSSQTAASLRARESSTFPGKLSRPTPPTDVYPTARNPKKDSVPTPPPMFTPPRATRKRIPYPSSTTHSSPRRKRRRNRVYEDWRREGNATVRDRTTTKTPPSLFGLAGLFLAPRV